MRIDYPTPPSPTRCPRTILKIASLSLAIMIGLASCTGGDTNILPDPEVSVAVLPRQADVAVGATHDLLIVACQDSVTLWDILFPAAATAIFVGLGRLDAIFYLPEAMAHAAIPQCDPISFTVSGASMSGSAFALSETDNGAAFHALAVEAGSGTFSASVTADGEIKQVSTTLNALVVDRIDFDPVCDRGSTDATATPSWLPAGATISFTYGLYHGDTPLTGYGLELVTHPAITVLSEGSPNVTVALTGEATAFTLTSHHDPTYERSIVTYSATSIDSLSLVKTSQEELFVGHSVYVKPEALITGEEPCVWGFPRQVTIETPEVCRFQGRTDVFTLPARTNAPFSIEGVATGLCRISASLPDTALSASVEFPVYAAFTQIPLELEMDLAMGLLDIWVNSAGDLTIVGYDSGNGITDGLILRRENGAWLDAEYIDNSYSLRAVHESETDGAIYAVGNQGLVVRNLGDGWERLETPMGTQLNGVWVFDAADVYVVGDNGLFVHFDGTGWEVIPSGQESRMTSVWGAPSGAVYIAGWDTDNMARYENGTVTPLEPVGVDLTDWSGTIAMAGTSESDLWFLNNGAILHWLGGDAWGRLSFTEEGGDSHRDIWSLNAQIAYALVNFSGQAFAYRLEDGAAFPVPVNLPNTWINPKAIGGAGETVYVLADDRLFVYTHDTTVPLP